MDFTTPIDSRQLAPLGKVGDNSEPCLTKLIFNSNQIRLAYPIKFKREIYLMEDKFKNKGKALQKGVCKKIHFLSTLNMILEHKEECMTSPSFSQCRVNFTSKDCEE